MSALEDRLLALGAALDSPPAPDLVPGVLARLEPRARRRRAARITSRSFALGLAAVLLLAGAAMAVTPVRHAVLDLFDLRGAKVQRVPRMPPGSKTPLPFGRPISVAAARHAASFRALLPVPPPQAAYVSPNPPGGRITLRAGRLLITEFEGSGGNILYKQLGPGTTLRRVRVNGGPGAYITGAPHQILIADRRGVIHEDAVHLAGNVLLWQQGNLLIRIEGSRSLHKALALARTLR